MLVDFSLLAILVLLALFSRRYWPLWATGFHLIACLTHLAVYADPAFRPSAYATYSQLWTFPTLGALILGCLDLRWLRPGSAGHRAPPS